MDLLRTDLLGSQRQQTQSIIVIITTTIIPRSLLRNAPHPSGVLRAVGAVPKHGPLQQQAGEKRAVKLARLGVSLAFFFFRSVRIPCAPATEASHCCL